MLVFGSHALAEAQEANVLRESVGDMEFSFTYDRGATVRLFGVPVIRESSFWIVNPTWTEHYFGGDLQKNLIETARVEPFAGGKKITLRMDRAEKDQFRVDGEMVFLLLPGNRYEASLDFTFTSLKPGGLGPLVFEWNPAMLNATLLAGRPCTLWGDGWTTEAVVEKHPAFLEREEQRPLGTSFEMLRLNSLIGPMYFRGRPAAECQFLDYRMGQWAEASRPVLWLGWSELPVMPGKRYSCRVQFEFPAKLPQAASDAAASPAPPAKAALLKVDNALSPNWGRDYVIPTPKSMQRASARFALGSEVSVYIGANPAPDIRNAAEFLRKDFQSLYGISAKIIAAPFPSATDGLPPRGAIVIASADDAGMGKALYEAGKIALPPKEKGWGEGYGLLATERAVIVVGQTPKGAFNGAMTLLQLVCVDDRGVFIGGAAIADYPSLEFRGVHHFTGKEAGGQAARAVRTLMARHKINTLVWECQRLGWKSHPEVWSEEYGMTLDDAQKVIDSARVNSVEIIPLVQSLSHSKWMFENNQHLEFAENPSRLDAYNPLHPGARKMVFEVYDEALKLFKPRTFHIGHDEVFFRDRLDYLNRDPSRLTDVIMEDTRIIHDWLKERGVRTMLWSDMFLYNDMGIDACNAPSAAEARRRRELLPKDSIICDWHYEQHQPERFRSLELFKSEGFDVIGCSWFRPPNITTLAEACGRFGALGFMKTTWAGYNFQIDGNPDAWVQYGNTLLAGQYAWTAHNVPIEDLPFNFREVFQDLWRERKPITKRHPGAVAELAPACNMRLADASSTDGLALADFPRNRELFGETRFSVQANAKGEDAILFDGLFNPPGRWPKSLSIAANGMLCSEAHFLLAATRLTELDTRLGSVIIHYADGSAKEAPLLYGKDIFAVDDLRVGNSSRVAWKGKNQRGLWMQFNDLAWTNPSPEKPVDSIEFVSAGRESSPILLAATFVEAK